MAAISVIVPGGPGRWRAIFLISARTAPPVGASSWCRSREPLIGWNHVVSLPSSPFAFAQLSFRALTSQLTPGRASQSVMAAVSKTAELKYALRVRLPPFPLANWVSRVRGRGNRQPLTTNHYLEGSRILRWPGHGANVVLACEMRVRFPCLPLNGRAPMVKRNDHISLRTRRSRFESWSGQCRLRRGRGSCYGESSEDGGRGVAVLHATL